jgi:predicted DNA-binding protein
MPDDDRDKQISFRAPDWMHQELDNIVENQGINKSDLLRNLISYAIETSETFDTRENSEREELYEQLEETRDHLEKLDNQLEETMDAF